MCAIFGEQIDARFWNVGGRVANFERLCLKQSRELRLKFMQTRRKLRVHESAPGLKSIPSFFQPFRQSMISHGVARAMVRLPMSGGEFTVRRVAVRRGNVQTFFT